MRFPSVRYCFAILLAISVSGCYSGGRWTTPDLAFWKSNPFSTTAKSTAPEPIPRPTEIASQPGPGPGAGYSAGGVNTADTLAPPYQAAPAALASQPTYPATQPGAGAPSPFVMPQQGYYDPNPPGDLTASRGSATNAYPVTGGMPSSPSQPPPGYHTNPYAARAGAESPAPFGADPSLAAQPYGSSPGGYVPANASGPYANPIRDDDRESYDARLADYRSAAGAYGTPIPDYRSGGSQPPWNQPPASPSHDPRFPPVTADARSGYGSGAPPAGYGANTPQGYFPPSGGYNPGNTGYNPPGAPPYYPPAGTHSYGPSSSTGDPGYSPGSVGRYDF